MDLTEQTRSTPIAAEALAFETVYEQYFTRVFKFVSYRLSDRDAAQDVTSDIFQKVYLNLASYDEDLGSFDVWIFTIARNTLNDYYRRRSKRRWIPLFKLNDSLPSSEDVGEHIEREEERAHLHSLVQQLKPRDRMILSYKFGAELSNGAIAELMDLEPGHVAVIVHRLLKQLKKDMEDYYET
ncbi:MAG: sigma-70 family RNA polymerase sigma factor [Peptoniphilus sp.]|nr:sigma-70 family RNA polymerase sigma factor [Peptoniphilus sp.]MDD7362834.1 sigma-70 family RNA polymerase sigma factor [Bacillota bacterium]MDY6043974.1 sigma-70 family RNA polymerase sigma factor [Peptoniphilus sp.]